ncbi:MAG: hypothetical protein JSS02_07350 [Planctomycetes bacterium]|nr:hypothetical protein [Planctomycetota bacterium]
MFIELLAASHENTISRLWYLVPLIVIVSLVYSASRFESPQRILLHAARRSVQIALFMALVLGLLAWLAAGL